jgi:glycosyltransferase involved in cell wall biosynthesis
LVKEATTPSLAYQNNKSMRTWILKKAASWTYPMAGSIIAVSKAAAEDMTRFFQLPPEKITILYNPVVTSDMLDKAELPSGHRWLDRADRPVVLSVGRLVSEKDHATLLKAFAIAKRDIPCRLIILGEGPERQNLVELAKSLEISSDFDLPGFVDNPFAWMSKASLFVSASRREGLPNSIIEAMACGLPVVSTDCPSGPREILNGGRLGSLVKVGDVDSLAKSMIQGLESPISSETLKESVAKYNDHLISNRYLSLFAETRNKALKRQ